MIKKYLSPYIGLPKEIYILFISKIVNSMGAFVMPLLTLIMTEKIGLSEGEAGFWMMMSGLIMAFTAPIGGKLADKVGRKPMIIFGEGMGVLFYTICAFLEPSMMMIYMLITASVFMSFAWPAHDALVADLTTKENRDKAYSLLYLGMNVGFAIGPTIGGLLFKNHLKILFIGDALTALSAMMLVFFFVKESIGKTHEVGEDNELEQRVEGNIFKVIWDRPILIWFSLAMFGYNFVYSQWGYLMPMHSAKAFGDMGAKYFGFMSSFNGLIVMIGTPILIKIGENKSEIRKMVWGGILYTIGFGMLGIIDTLMAFFTAVLIFTIGEVYVTVNSMPFITNHTPASHRGRMSSVLPLIMGMGYTVSPFLTGNVLLKYFTYKETWLFVGAFMLLFTLFMKGIETIDKPKEVLKVKEKVS